MRTGTHTHHALRFLLQRAWREECDSKRVGGQRPSLRRALWKAFGAEVMVGGLWKMGWSIFVILGARGVRPRGLRISAHGGGAIRLDKGGPVGVWLGLLFVLRRGGCV